MLTPAYAPTATERVLPRLALDFTTGVLDPRVTVARALNTATRINSSGLVEVVNADLPRFDYDPTTLAPKGLLIEETRINYIRYSEDFTQADWQKLTSGAGVLPVVTPNYEIAPDGSNTATRIQLDAGPNGASDYSLLRQSSLGPGGTVSRGIWAKSNTGTNQVVAIVATNPATKVTIAPTWQRIILPNSTSGAQQFDISVGGTAATPATADISIWGAQHEVGAFATSYIPTTTTSLTRNADFVSMTGTNFSDWYNASEGTFVVSYDQIAATTSQIKTLAVASDGTGNNRVYGYISNSGSPALLVSNGGAAQASLTNALIASGLTMKTAFSYKLNAFAIATNGGAVATDTSGTVPLTTDRLNIGCFSTGAQANGHIQSVRYFDISFLVAELQAFSK